jgi:Peptidase inhibitor family I36
MSARTQVGVGEISRNESWPAAKWLDVTKLQSRRVLVALLLAAAVSVAAVALTTPERAGAAFGSCPAGDLCLWEHDGYEGARYHSPRSDRDLRDNVFPGTNLSVFDGVSSVVNAGVPHARDDVRLYYLVSRDAPSLCVPRLGRIINLGSYRTPGGASWNDGVAGYRWVESC